VSFTLQATFILTWWNTLSRQPAHFLQKTIMSTVLWVKAYRWNSTRARLEQNFSPGNLTPIQPIPYTHNKFWNHNHMRTIFFVWPSSHKKKVKILWLGPCEINKGYLLNCTFTLRFFFFQIWFLLETIKLQCCKLRKVVWTLEGDGVSWTVPSICGSDMWEEPVLALCGQWQSSSKFRHI